MNLIKTNSKCGKASAKHIWEISQARHFGGKAGKHPFTPYSTPVFYPLFLR